MSDAEPARTAPPLRTWRPMALWTAGLMLLVGLIGLVAAVAVPCYLTARTIRTHAQGHRPKQAAVEALGGPERTLAAVRKYLVLPARLAPHKSYAVSLLSRCGQPAVPVLRRMLNDEEPAIRASSARALAGIGPEATPAAAALIAALGDPNEEVRKAVVGALWSIGPGIASARPAPGEPAPDQPSGATASGQDAQAARNCRLVRGILAVSELKRGASLVGQAPGESFMPSGRSGSPVLSLNGEGLIIEVDLRHYAIAAYYDKDLSNKKAAASPKADKTPSREMIARALAQHDIFQMFGWSEYRGQFPGFVPVPYYAGGPSGASFRADRVWQGHRYYRDHLLVRLGWDGGELMQFCANFTPEPPTSWSVKISPQEAEARAREAVKGNSCIASMLREYDIDGGPAPATVAVEQELLFVQPNGLLTGNPDAQDERTGPARLAYTATARYPAPRKGTLMISIWIDAADGRPLGLGDYGMARTEGSATK